MDMKTLKAELLAIALGGPEPRGRLLHALPMHRALIIISQHFQPFTSVQSRIPANLYSTNVGRQEAAHNRLMMLNKLYPEE